MFIVIIKAKEVPADWESRGRGKVENMNCFIIGTAREEDVSGSVYDGDDGTIFAIG